MFHVDQVPLPFASPSGRTLNPKGSKSCRIAGPNTSGLDKRQATLQLWICADGNHQCVRPALIFRGSSGPRSKVPWPNELAIYEELGNIRVHFQKNAWADGKFCQDDILEVAYEMYAGGVVGEVLIGMDNHSAQKTDEIEALYARCNLIPLYTPSGCTDCISPVDHHVGRFIQNAMSKAYQQEILTNPEVWFAANAEELDNPECKSAVARRILIARWLSAAWTDLTTNDKHLIESAFVQTGLLVAKDGSEDKNIQLQGWSLSEQYTYRQATSRACACRACADK